MFWHVPVILGVLSLVQCKEVSVTKEFLEVINDDDFRVLFRTTDPNAIPEYEIAPIMHNLHDLSNQNLRIKINVFGKAINSYLIPTDNPLAGVDTPIWRPLINYNGTLSYEKLPKGILGNKIQFYHSRLNFYSMLVLNGNSSSPCFEGHIDGLIIRSLPASVQKKIVRTKNLIQPLKKSLTLIQSDYHLIMKSNLHMSEDAIESAKEPIKKSASLHEPDEMVRVMPLSNDRVFPSLMINADYIGNAWLIYDDSRCKVFIIDQLIFWNAVDVRFKYVSDPKIRLRIAGIIIGGNSLLATPYKYNVARTYKEMQRVSIEMNAGHSKFFEDTFDLFVTMTDFGKTWSFNRFKGFIMNISSSGCLGTRDGSKSVAIINDRGAYNEVPVATEALSRLMGLGYIDRESSICDRSFRFKISNPLKVSTIKPKWSACSLYKLPTFFNPTSLRKHIFKGLKTTDKKQCQLQGYIRACVRSPEICGNLRCYMPGWGVNQYELSCQNTGRAYEGTVCSPGHICLNGQCSCVSKNCVSY